MTVRRCTLHEVESLGNLSCRSGHGSCNVAAFEVPGQGVQSSTRGIARA